MRQDITFNAADARKLVSEAQSLDGAFAKEETAKILERIKTAANQAMRSISTTIEYKYRETIVTRLKNLGFTVNIHSDQRDGDYVTVSW
jgi:hypothetical protein